MTLSLIEIIGAVAGNVSNGIWVIWDRNVFKLKLEEKRVGCWNNSGHPPIELFGIL
ncbi:MAG: hypothetical protein WAM14_09805 [Candidatus Nitrosopolaris sp.]